MFWYRQDRQGQLDAKPSIVKICSRTDASVTEGLSR